MTEKKDISFNEQAFLIWQHFAAGIRNKGKSKFNKGQTSKSSTTLHKIIGNYTVNNFVSKVTGGRNSELYRSLIDLETHKITALVPRVKLFKIKDNNLHGRTRPFIFNMVQVELGIFPHMFETFFCCGGTPQFFAKQHIFEILDLAIFQKVSFRRKLDFGSFIRRDTS